MTGLDENHIDQSVGGRVRQRRIALNMTQAVLAEKLGIAPQQVQKMERGVNRIGAGRLWQIASILSVPVSYFYDGVNRGRTLDPQQQASHAAANHFLGRREGLKMAIALHEMNPNVRGALVRFISTLHDQSKRGLFA